MATMAEDILAGFNAEELAAWSKNGCWGSFRTNLRELEMIEAARGCLPEGHPAKQGLLQGTVDRCLNKVVSSYKGYGRMLCADQMRLLNLTLMFRDAPQARKQIKTILDKEMEKDAGEMKAAPGCQDPQAHWRLLRTWSTLNTEDHDNRVVEDVITDAIFSHNRKKRQQPRLNQGYTQASLFISSDDAEAEGTEKGPFESIPVQQIRLSDPKLNLPSVNFERVSVRFIRNAQDATLEVQIQELRIGIPDSKYNIDLGCTYSIYHSPSKRNITVSLATHALEEIMDVSLHTTRLGELFLQRLEILPTYGGPIDLDDALRGVSYPKSKYKNYHEKVEFAKGLPIRDE